MLGCALALGLSSCESVPEPAQEPRWVSLFDGETLDGWFLHHGEEPFTVRDGAIVGATYVDIPTRYLTTNAQYGDFILELEMNNARGQNSGVQFRSVTDAPFYAGLTGYQLEVDPSPRNWTGGIYFEGVGTFIHPPLGNPACNAAWDREGWNRLRIEARGEEMRTFVNDVPCAQLFDQYLSRGHIGLQVHSIGSDPAAAGAETLWRNIRIVERPRAEDYRNDAVFPVSQSHLIDRLSPVEMAQDWRLLRLALPDPGSPGREAIVNPIDLRSWFPTHVLTLDAESDSADASFVLPTEHYRLVADFQLAPGTAGTATYPITLTSDGGETMSCTGSYRIFDDRSLAERDADDPMLMGSLTGAIAARNLSEAGRGKRVLYGDAWRRLEIVVRPDGAEHWLNMVKVVTISDCSHATGTVPERTIKIALETGKLRFRTIKFRPE